MRRTTSAAKLLAYLQALVKRATFEMNEGASQLLATLETCALGEGLRRVYNRLESGEYAIRGAYSDEALHQLGYYPSDEQGYGLVGNLSVENDFVTRWTHERKRGLSMWVGEPLKE